MIELFCGSAGLSCAFLAEGDWEVLGIDWKGNRARPVDFDYYLELDLRQPQAQQTLREILDDDSTQGLHAAIPCGTGSRAREIPLPAWKSQRHLGIPDPGPLRSEAEPWGISNVKDPIDRARLESANKLILVLIEVAKICRTKGIVCIVENPYRSLLWNIPELWALVSDFADFSACMTGGARDKRQRLASLAEPGSPAANRAKILMDAFRNRWCDGSHALRAPPELHAPWGNT